MVLQDQPSLWMGEFFSRYVVALLTQLPLFLAYLGGLCVALIGRRKHSKVSFITILAIVILMFDALVMTGIQVWLPRYWLNYAHSPRELRTLMDIVGAIRNLVAATGVGALMLAVFMSRSSRLEPIKPV